MRARAAALSIALLVAGAGCDELGNRPIRRGATPPTEWTNGVVRTVTQTITVPSTEADALRARVPGGVVHHVDTVAEVNGVVTLVTVDATFAAATSPLSIVPLVTTFAFGDGSYGQRRWAAPAAARARFVALFALPSRPYGAATAVGR